MGVVGVRAWAWSARDRRETTNDERAAGGAMAVTTGLRVGRFTREQSRRGAHGTKGKGKGKATGAGRACGRRAAGGGSGSGSGSSGSTAARQQHEARSTKHEARKHRSTEAQKHESTAGSGLSAGQAGKQASSRCLSGGEGGGRGGRVASAQQRSVAQRRPQRRSQQRRSQQQQRAAEAGGGGRRQGSARRTQRTQQSTADCNFSGAASAASSAAGRGARRRSAGAGGRGGPPFSRQAGPRSSWSCWAGLYSTVQQQQRPSAAKARPGRGVAWRRAARGARRRAGGSWWVLPRGGCMAVDAWQRMGCRRMHGVAWHGRATAGPRQGIAWPASHGLPSHGRRRIAVSGRGGRAAAASSVGRRAGAACPELQRASGGEDSAPGAATGQPAACPCMVCHQPVIGLACLSAGLSPACLSAVVSLPRPVYLRRPSRPPLADDSVFVETAPCRFIARPVPGAHPENPGISGVGGDEEPLAAPSACGSSDTPVAASPGQTALPFCEPPSGVLPSAFHPPPAPLPPSSTLPPPFHHPSSTLLETSGPGLSAGSVSSRTGPPGRM